MALRLILHLPCDWPTNAKIQKTNTEYIAQLKKLGLELETHKIQADELRLRNRELEKELETSEIHADELWLRNTKLNEELETHKIHFDELRLRNTELVKELEERDNKIREIKNIRSDALARELSRMKNEVEMYKSIVKKEAESSNDARFENLLFDRMLAALKAEKNKVEIYQLLLDQDVKYLNDNRLNGTLFAEGLHCNAPNKQYIHAKFYNTFCT